MTKVAVLGAAGRMGATVCSAVDAAADLELVGAVDPGHGGVSLGEVVHGISRAAATLTIAPDLAALERVDVDAAVDFTVAAAARENLRWCASHGVHAVCGTTGLSDEDMAELAGLFGPGRPANAVVAANFSIGAVLMMRSAELCAPFFEGVEIIELHHEHKRDAPSGTSLATAARIEAAREAHGAGNLVPDPTVNEIVDGARGGALASGVHVHSIRLPGFVAHQEVLLGSPGETLSIRHDLSDRISFMPGVLLALRKVSGTDGLTVGLDPLLGI